MADRKVTVLNPAGYQEQLPDSDNLLLAAAPTANTHAVNKLYVDTGLSNLDVTLDLQDVTDAGNTTTNDITIGNISLNANGSASFIGPVTALGKVISGAIEIEPYTSSPGSFSLKAFNSSTPTILLNQDGSASFAGGQCLIGAPGWINAKSSLTAGPQGPGTTGYFYTSEGTVYGYKRKDDDSGSEVTYQLNRDGSAIFEGGVDVRTQDSKRGFTIYSSSDSQLEALKINANGGAQVALIKHDGSAEFTGNTTVGDLNAWTDKANKHSTFISQNGSIELYNPNKSSSNALISGYGQGDEVISIKTDGSATFAGTVTANKLIGDIDCGEY